MKKLSMLNLERCCSIIRCSFDHAYNLLSEQDHNYRVGECNHNSR